MILLPGDSVGPYRIVERVGQGGMATVYKATQTTLDRFVALKVLHPALAGDQNFLARFNREARIVARLIHPNIVPIYDFAEQDGTPYLVLQFVDGTTLKSSLGNGPLPLERVLTLMRPVANALDYAHSQGILHRDIKPSNIICANDGKVFLTDFGLASLADTHDPSISQNVIIGTPYYISPEQARGEPATDKSDAYSLCVLLYEMLVGRVPFDADSPMTVVHEHIYATPPMPKALNPAIPEQVDHALLKGLAKDPARRFASAGELMAALELAAPARTKGPAIAQPQETTLRFVPASPIPAPASETASSPAVAIATNNAVSPAPSSPAATVAAKTAASPAPSSPAAAAAAHGVARRTQVDKRPGSGRRIGPILIGFLAMLIVFCAFVGIGVLNATGWSKTLLSAALPASSLRSAQMGVANRPRDPVAHIALGDAYAGARQYNLAFAEYDTAIGLDPRNPRAYQQAGELAVEAGDLVRAERYFSLGRTASRDDIGLLIAQGDVFVKLKRYGEARTDYERVERISPGNAQAVWRVGDVDRAQGRQVQALASYAQALGVWVVGIFR